jgi:CBS-domain-containing membrane protein
MILDASAPPADASAVGHGEQGYNGRQDNVLRMHRVAEVMSSEIKYYFDDQDINDVLRNMSDIQVRRLPVVNREKRVEAGIATGSGRKTSDSVPLQKRHWMQYGL